jgi:hypothetical protein
MSSAARWPDDAQSIARSRSSRSGDMTPVPEVVAGVEDRISRLVIRRPDTSDAASNDSCARASGQNFQQSLIVCTEAWTCVAAERADDQQDGSSDRCDVSRRWSAATAATRFYGTTSRRAWCRRWMSTSDFRSLSVVEVQLVDTSGAPDRSVPNTRGDPSPSGPGADLFGEVVGQHEPRPAAKTRW